MSEQNNSIVVAKILYNCDTIYLAPPPFDVKRGNLIIVETSNGPEIASVSGTIRVKPDGTQLVKILRQCTEEDLKVKLENDRKSQEAYEPTVEKIRKHNLNMKLVTIHYFFDDNKILFSFTADERVDFRELVKDLASVFKRRIELRQIGARDEAKIVKGTGICGRDFCCTAIKNEPPARHHQDGEGPEPHPQLVQDIGRLRKAALLPRLRTHGVLRNEKAPARGRERHEFRGADGGAFRDKHSENAGDAQNKGRRTDPRPPRQNNPSDKLEQLRAVRIVGPAPRRPIQIRCRSLPPRARGTQRVESRQAGRPLGITRYRWNDPAITADVSFRP